MNRASVTGIGSWFPETVRTNDAWPDDFVQDGRARGDRTLVDIPHSDDAAGRISAEYLAHEASDPFMGAIERRVAPDSLASWEAGLWAAEAALEDAGLKPQELDVVLSYEAVPDRISPGGGSLIAKQLGARETCALSIDTACATALTQLLLARSLVESGQARHVLLTQTHLLLRTFPMKHPASPGLGDAATALVVSRETRWPILGSFARTLGEYYRAVTWCRGRDDASDPPWWKGGGDYCLGSREPAGAQALMQDTVHYGATTIADAMREAGAELTAIDVVASVHPRRWIPEAIARCLGLSPHAAECAYDRYAHLGACGPLVNWVSARERGRLEQGALLALYSQGAGFTRAAAVVEIPRGT